ncbi:MAG: uroporphyrinogen-III C-methyltransferase, partial [Gammaproteobacteria bacterium]|nr:uroporphyrinogen-III C-methyltransferase [Gammaproteobacteria bacterium]
MSETNKDQDLEPVEETVAPEPDVTEEADAPAEETAVEETAVEETAVDDRPAKRRGSGVGWLALLLSLIALAAVGYSFYIDWLAEKDSSTDDAVAGLESRLAATRESLSSLSNRLAELAEQDSAAADAIAALRQELDVRVNSLNALPGRMSTLESSVSSLAGISKGARDAWLIAEAEYYMQIANAQLQLANNPHLAARALEMADERVVQIGSPALIDVRRAISDELAALDVMEKPDIAGATLTLASLARVVESLPLAGSERVKEEPEPADEEQSGLSRAWSSVKSAMSGLVRVTPPDQAKLALVSPDAEYFLRNNLALQLQSARLALLRGEQAVFTQTLDD